MPDPKHLVIDARTATDHFPGIGRYVTSLSHALAEIAPHLAISLLYDPTAATRLALPDRPRVACPISPFSIRQQWLVPSQLQRLQATLYHSPFYLMPYWPGRPSLLTCYDLIPLIYPHYFTAMQRLVYRAAHWLALKTARLTLAISQATRNDLIRYFQPDPARIIVTPLATDSHFCPQPPQLIERVRRKYALPEGYSLYFGSNKPHKNLVRLVKAWALVKEQMPNIKRQTSNHALSAIENVKLVIAGHWDKRYPQAKAQAEQMGLKDEVIFAGPVDEADLPALYSGSTLFVFPSEYEGFGLPVLEAMACGAPVVSSAASSLPEVAGQAALLIDAQDTDALAAAIKRVLADEALQQSMREQGLTQAARFSWAQTARATLSAYERLTE